MFIAITVVTYIHIYIHIYIYLFVCGSIRLLFAPSVQYSRESVENITFHATFFAYKENIFSLHLVSSII